MITYCADCDNVHPSTQKGHPARWLCIKFPRLEGFGFVTKDAWEKFEPYMPCKDINGGNCPLYQEKQQ